ncbi:hypothetical protein GOV04_00395 [Candidatus Woesearchaeota archaeon]|nr:hypothetical protein [Candidatus Woesearchaeota archaeon]
MLDAVLSKIRALTGKEYVLLTRRGNIAVLTSFQLAQHKGIENVYLQDMGGWMTYPQYAHKLGLNVIMLKTDYGLIDVDVFEAGVRENSVLLVNSMTGYFAMQDMAAIQKAAKETNTLLVNDASASIGTNNAKIGDIIIGSFGNAKPVEAGSGGFIATSDQKYFDYLKASTSFNPSPELLEKIDYALTMLPQRLAFLSKKRNEALADLKAYDFNVLKPEANGINVIVKYNNEQEKNNIINYCNTHKLEYTMCPRYIRVNDNAISIEIKRLREE